MTTLNQDRNAFHSKGAATAQEEDGAADRQKSSAEWIKENYYTATSGIHSSKVSIATGYRSGFESL
jgi:hypothetical protein